MGLNASVMCTCYAEGRCSPPPLPEHVRLDEDGFLVLDLPSEGHEEDYFRFDAWQEHACAHEGMRCAWEWISNWTGVRTFQEALREVGAEHYLVLLAEIPGMNGGTTTPTRSATALEELDRFRALERVRTEWVLLDVEHDYEVYHWLEAYGGVFQMDGGTGTSIGVDRNGMFIHQADPWPTRGQRLWQRNRPATDHEVREVFRAMRMEQRLLEPGRTEAGRHGLVEYVDVDSGTIYRCRTAVSGRLISWPNGEMEDRKGRVRCEYPRRLEVVQRQRTPDHYAGIVEALTRVFVASVETGNPVRWT